MMKRCFSLLLSFVLLLTLLSGAALAADQNTLVSGTVSLAGGLSGGEYSGIIVLEPMTNGEAFSAPFSFTGTSCSYEIPSYRKITGTFYLSFTVHDGSGVICNWPYYYVEDGSATTDRSQATPITLDGTGTLSIDLTIPKARVISGRFVSADGGAVVWNSEVGPWLNVTFSDGRSERCRLTVGRDGTWSTTLDPQLTGQATLSSPLTSEYSTNILTGRTYYYNNTSTSAVTNGADASPVTLLGSEDITGLDLYVDTGWLLSGQLHLPEGGYIKDGEINVRIALQDENGRYTGSSGSGTIGPDGGSYFITAPKEEATYSVVLQFSSSLPSGVSSNLYCGDNLTLDPVLITGDTSGLDFTLVKAGALITGTVYRPEGFEGALNLTVDAQMQRESSVVSYSAYPCITRYGDSAQFTIAVPTSETARQYKLCYTISSSVSGVLSGKNVYLSQDGSLTTDISQAGTFSLDQPTAHAFTPLTEQPFVTGRIYCPEGLDRMMTFVVDYRTVSELSTFDMTSTAVEVMVGPNYGQQDEDGRWYSTYSLAGLEPGDRYRLGYYSNDNSDVIDTNWHYINGDGSAVSAEGDATVYTVPASGSSTLDFTPILWNEGSEDYVLQSEHGITSLPQTAVYTYTYPDPTVEKLRVTFSARTDMDLTVNGSRYAFSSLAGQTLEVDGNTLTVELAAFDSYVNKFGFAVEKVEPVGGSAVSQPGAAAVYTPSGSSAGAILADVKAGQPVRVSLAGQPAEESSLLGALYDERGVLLDFVQVPAADSTASLYFDEYGEAVTLKLFLMDGSWVPEMDSCVFSQP